MEFLATIAGKVIVSLLSMAAAALYVWWKLKQERAKDRKTTEDARDKMDNAQTAEEIDDAADDVLGGI